jgi:hypothetical protein
VPHLTENEEIQEMHRPEAEHHKSHILTQTLDEICRSTWRGARRDPLANKAKIDEIKPDQQQPIDGIRQQLIPEQTIDQKDASIAVKTLCDPNGQPEAKREIRCVK